MVRPLTHRSLFSSLLLIIAVGASARVRGQQLEADHALIAGSGPDRLLAALSLCESRQWPALRAALLDPSPTVRQLAVTCWEPALGDVELLAGLTGDPSASVRTSLAYRLGADPSEVAVAAMRALADDPDRRVRRAALEQIPFESAEAALALFVPHLRDPALDVAAVAAGRLHEARVSEGLDRADRETFESALALWRLSRESPEVAGAIVALDGRIDGLAQLLGLADYTDPACASATKAGLMDLRARLVRLAHEAPPGEADRFEALLTIEDDFGAAGQAYRSCLSATPLVFTENRETRIFDGYSLLVLGEVGTAWEANFGLLRSDLVDRRGGELLLETTLGVDLLFPQRPLGLGETPGVPSLELSGRLDHFQFFKYEQLSGFGGGLLARGQIPFGCGGYRRCQLGGSLLGLRSPGVDEDFPERLVAGQRRFAGLIDFVLPFGDVINRLSAEAERVRYEDLRLEPAALDTFSVKLEVDSPFQLRLEAERNLYATTGPVDNRSSANASLDRDSTILSGMLGVRFGQPSPGDTLQLYVLGGMAFPLVDAIDTAVDPEIVFAAFLAGQSGSTHDDFWRLRLGGRRYVEASPRDFAIQAVSESFLAYTYQGLSLPDSGVRFDASFSHQLTDYQGALTEELAELDVNLLEGRLAVRFIFSEWIGMEVGDIIRAIRLREGAFETANRFYLSLFVPIGDYGLGREDELPW